MDIREQVTTDVDFTHEELYTGIVGLIGIETLVHYLPATKEVLQQAVQEDRSLNTIPFKEWAVYEDSMRELLETIGDDSFTTDEVVHVLKQAARMAVTWEVLDFRDMTKRMQGTKNFLLNAVGYFHDAPGNQLFDITVGDRTETYAATDAATLVDRVIWGIDACMDTVDCQTFYDVCKTPFCITNGDGYTMQGELINDIIELFQAQRGVYIF